MTDKRTIKALLIEDDPADVALIAGILSSEDDDVQIDLERVERLCSALDRLGKEEFEVILADLSLPDSRGIETFVKIHDHFPNIPIIVLTGLDDKDITLTTVRKGAQDYLIKGRVDRDLLVRSILYCIERQKLLVELETRMKEIKTLRGMIPICAWCKKIRDDAGYWKIVEEYIEEHTYAAFTHGMCEECAQKALAELEQRKKRGLIKDE